VTARVSDFSYFDEDDKAQMSARMALCRVLRWTHIPVALLYKTTAPRGSQRPNKDPVISSVVYVENEEAKHTFQAMKHQLAEHNRDNKEVCCDFSFSLI
jgi:hypothetical protein